MSKTKKAGSRGAPAREEPREARQQAPGQAARETVESIAVAVILAFLFRAFVAEAFVIPTGSMAPTLMGQHKDVECPECGYWYQTGASIEIEDEVSDQRLLEIGRTPTHSMVVGTTCPLCRYQQLLNPEDDANEATFSGDRILVSKFVYDFTSPKRWDVIVFKYPFNAKQNFIKRLIGLPGESIMITRGDIYIKSPGAEEFHIARKPDRKLRAMLQLVDDSKYISTSLTDVGWPLRWQPWSDRGSDSAGSCTSEDDGHTYTIEAAADNDLWLRYEHCVPTEQDWELITKLRESGDRLPDPEEYSPTLITDFYAYNAFIAIDRFNLRSYDPNGTLNDLPPSMFGSPTLSPYGTLGLHWVGDLALEGEVEVKSDEGELLLLLTKGGVDYTCRIDIATGRAKLAIDDGAVPFSGADGALAQAPQGDSQIQGSGKYSIRYSNIDAEIRLWVDGKRIAFDGPTTYVPRENDRPVATLDDPGDLAPVGIGACGATLQTQRLRVYRDIYYVATDGSRPHEYQTKFRIAFEPRRILAILNDPTTWPETKLFESRGIMEYTLTDDQYFPLGDNSPQSSDARMWEENYFERDLLIGRALLIYWPHPWYRPIPYMPNVKRMRLIH